MATTFTWAVSQLDRETADGYVFTAHYTVNAANSTYSAGAYGSVSFDRPETLVAFSALTEELVISWIQDKLGGEAKVTEIQDALQKQLDEQEAPTKASGVPWSA